MCLLPHDVEMVFRRVASGLAMAVLLTLCACSGPRIVENNAAAITVRYDPIVDSFDDVAEAANKACASYGKTARQRDSDGGKKTAMRRFAHFECLSK